MEPATGGILVGAASVGHGDSGRRASAIPIGQAGHAAGGVLLLGCDYTLLVPLRAAGDSQRKALEGLHGINQLSVDDDGWRGSAGAFYRHGLEDLQQRQAAAGSGGHGGSGGSDSIK